MMRKRVIFRFNMIEVALALVILAIGLSSVMVLFPVGLKASRNSIADNNLADVAERVGAYIQSRYTSSGMWGRDGTPNLAATGIENFDASPNDRNIPKAGEFNTNNNNNNNNNTPDGLFELVKGGRTYYLYQQYASTSGGNRAVDFEAVVRVGWDTDTMSRQYYLNLTRRTQEQLSDYKRSSEGISSDSPLINGNLPTSAESVWQQVLDRCCRALIIEISWPADAPWSNREKRIFHLEMFNENFVPYPQTVGGGGGGGGGS